jgi:hypothetical protein
MSSFPKNIAWPPIVATAASVLTRVRVLRLLNIIATLFPLRLPSKFLGIDPDFMAVLWDDALRTSCVNSAAERSPIDNRCRGTKGDVCGVDEEEYDRF